MVVARILERQTKMIGVDESMWSHKTIYDDRGRWWKYGAFCFNTKPETGSGLEGSAEWCLKSERKTLGFQFGRNGQESDIGLDVHVPFIGVLFLRLRSPLLKWARARDYKPRHTGVKINYAGKWVQMLLDKPDNGWSRDQHWWQEMSLTPTTVWGKRKMNKVVEATGETVIPMPEGPYSATWELSRFERFHVRWPGTWKDWISPMSDVHGTYSIEIKTGIPVQGKGTQAYNCGMDGVFGVSGPYRTLEQAIGEVVTSVLTDRRKYGGPHDLPSQMSVSEAETWVDFGKVDDDEVGTSDT